MAKNKFKIGDVVTRVAKGVKCITPGSNYRVRNVPGPMAITVTCDDFRDRTYSAASFHIADNQAAPKRAKHRDFQVGDYVELSNAGHAKYANTYPARTEHWPAQVLNITRAGDICVKGRDAYRITFNPLHLWKTSEAETLSELLEKAPKNDINLNTQEREILRYLFDCILGTLNSKVRSNYLKIFNRLLTCGE